MQESPAPKTFQKQPSATLMGVIKNFCILMSICLTSGALSWTFFIVTKLDYLSFTLMISGLVIGIVFAIVTNYRRKWAPYLTPFFAFFEGIFAGIYAYYVEVQLNYVTLQAFTMIIGIMMLTLIIYCSRLINVTDRFKTVMGIASISVILFYFSSMILDLGFGIDVVIIRSKDFYGTTFSATVVTIVSLLFFIDYDLIEKITSMKVSKFMEWYAAFVVTITIIWLFIESIHLLIKVR